jgi:hypothetical protein
VPASLEVLVNGKMARKTFQQVAADRDLRGQVVGKAIAELKAWRDRYGDLLDLFGPIETLDIIDVIDIAKRRMGARWPTLGDNIFEDGG